MELHATTRTDFLVPLPSVRSGLAQLLDLFGLSTPYNRAQTPAEADAIALRADWRVVGQDLRNAMNDFRTSLP